VVSGSPITSWFEAVGRFDLEAALSAFAPNGRLLSPDGRRAEGPDAIRSRLAEFASELRAVSYTVTAQWHVDDTWIAELDATYELRDYAQIGPVPRAVVARVSAEGIADLRVYGAHERTLADHRTGEEGIWVGKRWVPPL
jgi:hypothetical protein